MAIHGHHADIVADIKGLPEFKDWASTLPSACPSTPLINAVPGGTDKTTSTDIVQLTCYGNCSGYFPGFADDDQQVAQWMEDLYTVAPQLRGRVPSMYTPKPGSTASPYSAPSGQKPLPQLQRSIRSLHFAGYYTSETAGTHGAPPRSIALLH
ncbi:hypothetical protein QFZ36_002289 [Pseudarthrobacter siccitolerans]|uniref:Uncharacterized protein n=1 Tax=Pseudarthrobacter siccitolerans TaxID=861266 RepID=A0ABU0PL88_9MICC|nr:hypothetical protein [Pseudarthrobacter siccitolerans]MDQ0674728.1 hypothetical protein [Pseudarthrobacter siccitolerans]